MNLTFRGIGFTPDDEDREFLDKKRKKRRQWDSDRKSDNPQEGNGERSPFPCRCDIIRS